MAGRRLQQESPPHRFSQDKAACKKEKKQQTTQLLMFGIIREQLRDRKTRFPKLGAPLQPFKPESSAQQWKGLIQPRWRWSVALLYILLTVMMNIQLEKKNFWSLSVSTLVPTMGRNKKCLHLFL